jgi:concanavalin A-like lectin/glucanase superfamily protein
VPLFSVCSRRLSLFTLLACGALGACTAQQGDDGPSELVRRVPETSQNRALTFDGVDDYATTGTAQFPSGRGAQTISVWFEVEAISGKHALITLRKDIDSGVELALQDGLVGAWRVYGNRTLVIGTTPVTAGVWHHAAYTFDTMTNQIYVDGALVASTASAPDERTPTTCWLGTLDGTNDLFKGNIDDFRVFGVMRTSTQIANEAAGMFSTKDPGLVLYLPCNENGGSVVYDHSPLANDGELGDGIEPRLPTRITPGAPSEEN